MKASLVLSAILLSAVATLTATPVFAAQTESSSEPSVQITQARPTLPPATEAERKLMCAAIKGYTELNGTDFAIDEEYCLKSAMMTSEYLTTILENPIQWMKGGIRFNAPDRPSYTRDCQIAYFGAAEVKNLIGGVQNGIICE